MEAPTWIGSLLQQAWPLLLVFIVLGFFVRRGKSQRVQTQLQENTETAAAQGMGYLAPGQSGALVDEGEHHFSGTTRGIHWTAEVLALADQRHFDPDRTPIGRTPYTRWTAPSCGTASGALALMNLPRGTVAPASSERGGGLLQSLKDTAAAVALQGWLRMSFGSECAQQLSLQPEHFQSLDALDTSNESTEISAMDHAWRAFSDPPDLMQGLTTSARTWLMQAHDQRLQVLWHRQGLCLMWPTAQISPEQVKAFAEYGAELATRMGLPLAPPGA